MFVPRSVNKKSKPSQPSNNATSLPAPSAGASSGLPLPSVPNKGKGKEVHQSQQTDAAQDLAALVELSLSNHALWCAHELRMIIETREEREEGWISMGSVIRHSPILSSLDATEHSIAQAISAHGSGFVEVRMAVTTRYGAVHGHDHSLYHVRRKDWATVKDLELGYWTENDWNTRTIYVENIPPQHRTHIHSLISFLARMLSSPSTLFLVQGLSFPSRAKSEQEETKCRGFAFIVCGTVEEAEQAVGLWTWDGLSKRLSESTNEVIPEEDEVGQMRVLAKKCGFRALPQDQWMELKTQYLERRRYLQDQRQETRPTTLKHAAPSEPPQTSTANHPDEPTVPRFTEHNNPSSSDKIQCNFPRGCLVFVRNIHPETNKTTLKALLSQAFGDDPSGQELNYVDYTKGLDTCYVRTAASSFAAALVHFFSSRHLVQTEPSDDRGSSDMSATPVSVEIVDGKREEIYWEKVPEKARLAALSLASSSGISPEESDPGTGRKKRKR